MDNEMTRQADANPQTRSEPNTDLFVQYSAGSRYPAALEPEVRLMMTILEDAVSCYQFYFEAKEGRGRWEFEDAERWLFRDSRDWIFSFESICACVGLDANHIRSGLRRWKETALTARREGKTVTRVGRRVTY